MDNQDAMPITAVKELGAVHSRARAHVRAAAEGRGRRVRRGVYVQTSDWEQSSDEVRALTRILAVKETRQSAEVVFSHESAALLWGLPRLGDWPREVDVLSRSRRGAVRQNGVVWHRSAFSDDEVCERNGFLVTTLERTVLDIARSRSFANAVVALDLATRPHFRDGRSESVEGIERGALLEALDDAGVGRGTAVARAALRFSDNRSGSAGESLSRVQMHLLRFPRPRLQVAVPRRTLAGDDIVDFEWDDVIGEFDGKMKYTREQFQQGRTIDEVVWHEKVREDRLRRNTGKPVARWLWNDAFRPHLLRQVLLDFGIRPLSDLAYRRRYPDVA